MAVAGVAALLASSTSTAAAQWVAAGGVAAVVLVANAAFLWEILVEARGTFIPPGRPFATVVDLFAPIVLAAGVLVYVVALLRADEGVTTASERPT
jgi:hypothetical protein